MGKKRIIQKSQYSGGESLKSRALAKLPKKKIDSGVLNIFSTYNNTIVSLTDNTGNVVLNSSSGALGFSGARKGTPFAASKVADFLAERAKLIGLKEIGVKVKGIGAGREAALRSFAAKGFDILFIKDVTPVPHNGPKPPKPRRV
jgi:small subunit ribosomal protein S11